MSNTQPPQPEIPEYFIEQVKDALENLYDFPTLQRNPLAQTYEEHAAEANSTGAHRLRHKLIDAIETLHPGHDMAAGSGVIRVYNLVYLHYVGGLSLQEAALEIGISLRQVYRDLRRGQESVSAILWYSQNRRETAQPTSEPIHLSSIKTEITRLEGKMRTVHLDTMLETALRAVQKLAEKRDISIDFLTTSTTTLVTTNPAVAQQVLIHILSQVIQQIMPSHVRVSLHEDRGGIHIVLAYPAHPTAFMRLRIEPIIDQMLHQIRWKMQYRTEGSERQLIIRPLQEGALLLLIDDNQTLVDLLDHYLTGNTYRVVSARSGEDGLQMVQQLLPDAIILDLMMPGMDGWELLQRLRTNTDTHDIPVIICSVINDPELAYSLGASKFVPKPVTRETLLNAIRELRI